MKETLQPQAQANHRHAFDVVIVGSGGAGLSLALSLPSHLSIAVLAKDKLTEASTFYAQGGVAAVLSDDDSVDEHVDDTLIAGAGLCHEDAVRFTVEHSREAVEFLLKQGVKFTLDENETLHLTREGGHSKRRIIHAADATGVAISTSLVKRVKQCPNVKLFEYVAAIDVITTHKLSKHNYSPITEPNRAVG
ncbi:MAG: FAD-dependent oxidoreductase, partial [Moraxella sp.]|nr:FAD-dependent oxidoreductase [Moraxella sp.]